MKLTLRRQPLVCRQAVDLMAAYLDGQVSGRDRERLEDHLAACPHCHEHLAQLRVTIDVLGHAEPDHLSDDALQDLVGLYRQWRAE